MKGSKIALAAAIASALIPGQLIDRFSASERKANISMLAPSWRPYVGPTFRHHTKKGPGRSKGAGNKRSHRMHHVAMYCGRGCYEVRNLRKLLGTRK